MSAAALIAVLHDIRALLARPDNDFFWSRWAGETEALADIDAVLRRINAGETVQIQSLELLFAPTGSLQEVSLSSGWGEEFVRIAKRFDAAIADL